jgi:replicative DNA helicase
MDTQIIDELKGILEEKGIDLPKKIQLLKKYISNYEYRNEKLYDSVRVDNYFRQEDFLALMESGKSNPNKVITGYDSLDKKTGFYLGEFIVVGGRPAMGKTSFAAGLALKIAQTMPVLYLSLEMSLFVFTKRLIAALSLVELSKINELTLDDEEENAVKVALSKIGELNLHLYDNNVQSVELFEELVRREVVTNGVKVVIVDYIQLMGRNGGRNRDAELGEICKKMKLLAKELNLCIIALSQLNRQTEIRSGYDGKRPQLGDLRETGSLEVEADKVLFIHRPEYYKITEDENGNSLLGIAEIIVAKNRMGPTTDFYLRFIKKYALFEELDKDCFEIDFLDSRITEIFGRDNNTLPF